MAFKRSRVRLPSAPLFSLRPLPLLTRDTGLAKDDREKTDPDGSAMRIWNREDPIAAHHELVPPAREGSVESQRPEALDELPAADGTPRGHQLACLTRTTAFPSWGTLSLRATRTRTHSSTTSAS